MTLANQLTLIRIVFIPLFVVVFYLPFGWAHFASAMIFSVAAITDWADGYVARKYDQSTPFGAFLDPVADKLMVVIALALLVELHATPWFTAPAIVIIGREIVISALREWMAELGERASVAVSYIGKIKTTRHDVILQQGLLGGPDRPAGRPALRALLLAGVHHPVQRRPVDPMVHDPLSARRLAVYEVEVAWATADAGHTAALGRRADKRVARIRRYPTRNLGQISTNHKKFPDNPQKPLGFFRRFL